MPTAAVTTGIMSMLIFMTTGVPAVSGSTPSIWSILSRISTDTESMLTLSENSSWIIE